MMMTRHFLLQGKWYELQGKYSKKREKVWIKELYIKSEGLIFMMINTNDEKTRASLSRKR